MILCLRFFVVVAWADYSTQKFRHVRARVGWRSAYSTKFQTYLLFCIKSPYRVNGKTSWHWSLLPVEHKVSNELSLLMNHSFLRKKKINELRGKLFRRHWSNEFFTTLQILVILQYFIHGRQSHTQKLNRHLMKLSIQNIFKTTEVWISYKYEHYIRKWEDWIWCLGYISGLWYNSCLTWNS